MRGSCMCGQVVFESDGPWSAPIACHCTECRKLTGHFFAATFVRTDTLHFVQSSGLKWFKSSEIAQRGFCDNCGSTLFYRRNGTDQTFIAGGSLDQPMGQKLRRHMFVNEAGNYYDTHFNVQAEAGYGAEGPEALL